MVKVSEIRKTCLACPAQWEGETESGKIYIKLRWGHLSVRLGPTFDKAIGGRPVFDGMTWTAKMGHGV
jgi:hypothetical protein